jgi:hypothetical protein
VFGNWLVGISTIKQFVLQQADAADTIDNTIRDNMLGLNGNNVNGVDQNGYDLFYDGSGSGNCFANNAQNSPNIPADNSTFAPCPHTGANAFNQELDNMTIQWVAEPAGAHWVRHPHAPKSGYKPLELWKKSFDPGSAVGGP